MNICGKCGGCLDEFCVNSWCIPCDCAKEIDFEMEPVIESQSDETDGGNQENVS